MLVHRFTKVVAFATFVLLVIGGTVNPTGSSLACPEPTFVCNGELFPPMVGGVFYEHGHRLAAMTVGILQIILTILLVVERPKLSMFGHLWRELVRSTSKTKMLGLLLLAMVIGQGVLGAITVKYKLPWYVSTAHLLLAMSYFATLIYTAFRTRPLPSVVEIQQREKRRAELGQARTWIVAACAFVFVQLLLGALVRHHGAAMVCLGMPTCTIGGEFWPEAPVQQLHMIHRGFGVLTGLVTTVAAIQVLRTAKSWSNLRTLALIAPLLVAVQIVLGIYTVLTMRSVPLAVGHFAGAASLWALWMSAYLMTRDRTVRSVSERDTHPLPSATVRVA
ncbi:MAG: COX15/CtaA family protein [Kofleriaceae bacterium]